METTWHGQQCRPIAASDTHAGLLVVVVCELVDVCDVVVTARDGVVVVVVVGAAAALDGDFVVPTSGAVAAAPTPTTTRTSVVRRRIRWAGRLRSKSHGTV